MPKPSDDMPDRLLRVLNEAILSGVRKDGPDLSSRQFAVLLTTYLGDGPHTVRGLASHLNVSKPAISRALDRLSHLDLVRRRIDREDRRSIFVTRTSAGAACLKDYRESIAEAWRQMAAPT